MLLADDGGITLPAKSRTYAAQCTVPGAASVDVITSDVLEDCTVRERTAGAGTIALKDTDNSRTAEVREEVLQAGGTQGDTVSGLALLPLEPVVLQCHGGCGDATR